MSVSLRARGAATSTAGTTRTYARMKDDTQAVMNGPWYPFQSVMPAETARAKGHDADKHPLFVAYWDHLAAPPSSWGTISFRRSAFASRSAMASTTKARPRALPGRMLTIASARTPSAANPLPTTGKTASAIATKIRRPARSACSDARTQPTTKNTRPNANPINGKPFRPSVAVALATRTSSVER
jgi:hypothetical protein